MRERKRNSIPKLPLAFQTLHIICLAHEILLIGTWCQSFGREEKERNVFRTLHLLLKSKPKKGEILSLGGKKIQQGQEEREKPLKTFVLSELFFFTQREAKHVCTPNEHVKLDHNYYVSVINNAIPSLYLTGLTKLIRVNSGEFLDRSQPRKTRAES